jgi:hypothetical protein
MVFAVDFDDSAVPFDRVQVRGIRRQEQKSGSPLFNPFLGIAAFVNGDGVHDNDMVLVQAWTELPLQPVIEDVRIACSLKQNRFFKALADARGDQRRARPPFSCTPSINALSLWRRGITPIGRRREAAFIDRHTCLAPPCMALTKAKIRLSFDKAALLVTRRFFYG